MGGDDWLPADREAVQSALIEWYERSHRPYPWRDTDDPWAILVCEVMSQQTQLERVEPAWEAFIERWPTAASLAAVDRSEVVSFWSEHRLGYNNRAVYLHRAAAHIESAFEGTVPSDPATLEELPGVGPYTANAVASFAFNTGGAVVDTNVRRVCHRAFGVPDEDDTFEAVAATLLPAGRSRTWNNAIMELGGVACTKTPACDEAECPWREWCVAYATGDFTAPDVPTQPPYEGSHRQMRARVIDALREHGTQDLATLGPRVRVDYGPDGTVGREWLETLCRDLADDDLVTLTDREDSLEVSLAR